jgi:predicted transcriptional regulator
MNILTISELQRIITLRKAEKLADKEFYLITEKGKKIVGKIKFLKVDVAKITLEETYTRI